MSPLLHGLSAVVFLLTARCYFKGGFRAAILGGVVFSFLDSAVAMRECPPVAAALLLLLLVALPWGFLGVHIVDVRHGYFLLPTIYSIPLLFVASAMLWCILSLVLLVA